MPDGLLPGKGCEECEGGLLRPLKNAVRVSRQLLKSRRWIFIALAALATSLAPCANLAAQALPETAEAIAKARITTRILFVTAHPDDETASMLAYLSHGLDADVALLTLTRGQGGQNAIGPEQDGQLGVIRTTELLAADSHYGGDEFFTRANDPGFSKSPERTMKLWGDDVPLEDMVRVIRIYRPQIVINGWGGGHWGHRQHQASGILTPKAIEEAADPNAFPDQIKEGLKPWKVTLEVRPAGGGFGPATNTPPGAVQLPVNDVSPIWGESYVEIGMEGHAQHRSQGTPFFFGNPFFRRPIYLVAENAKGELGKFDGKLLAEPLSSLGAQFGSLQSGMAPVLSTADGHLRGAAKSIAQVDRGAAASSLAAAGKSIKSLREQV